MPPCSPKPSSRMLEIESARQTAEDCLHLRQNGADAVHVSPHECVRQPARAGKCLDVLLRRLGMTFVPERQGGYSGRSRRPACTFQLVARTCSFFRAARATSSPDEIAPDDAGVDMADRRHRLTATMIANINLLQTLISATEAECRKVRTVHWASVSKHLRRLLSPSRRRGAPRRRRPTRMAPAGGGGGLRRARGSGA